MEIFNKKAEGKKNSESGHIFTNVAIILAGSVVAGLLGNRMLGGEAADTEIPLDHGMELHLTVGDIDIDGHVFNMDSSATPVEVYGNMHLDTDESVKLVTDKGQEVIFYTGNGADVNLETLEEVVSQSDHDSIFIGEGMSTKAASDLASMIAAREKEIGHIEYVNTSDGNGEMDMFEGIAGHLEVKYDPKTDLQQVLGIDTDVDNTMYANSSSVAGGLKLGIKGAIAASVISAALNSNVHNYFYSKTLNPKVRRDHKVAVARGEKHMSPIYGALLGPKGLDGFKKQTAVEGKQTIKRPGMLGKLGLKKVVDDPLNTESAFNSDAYMTKNSDKPHTVVEYTEPQINFTKRQKRKGYIEGIPLHQHIKCEGLAGLFGKVRPTNLSKEQRKLLKK